MTSVSRLEVLLIIFPVRVDAFLRLNGRTESLLTRGLNGEHVKTFSTWVSVVSGAVTTSVVGAQVGVGGGSGSGSEVGSDRGSGVKRGEGSPSEG